MVKAHGIIPSLNFVICDPFSNTITSYNPDSSGKSSGKSGADVERILAFHSIGRKDPIEYVDDWEVVLNDALRIQKKYNEGKK